MARDDRWRDDRRWDFDREAREMRQRPDYGQTDREGGYGHRYAERDWEPYGAEAEDLSRQARRAQYGRREDDARRTDERAYRPFGTTGPTAYGSGDEAAHAWGGSYAPYGYGAPHGGYNYGPGADRQRSPYAPAYSSTDRYTPDPRESRGGEPRSFLNKAADEVASWFGDHDAERRRRVDDVQATHRGRGPKSYKRSDERVQDDINDRLTEDAYLDATDIEVTVKDGDVTLTGFVAMREDKRRAERLAENVAGVGDVQNNLRLRRPDAGEDSAEPKGAVGNF